MAELHLKGWLTDDYDRIIGLSERNDGESWENRGYSIISSIESFASENGMTGNHNKGLGGRKAYIDNCNMRAYFTDKECTLEEAMESMITYMCGGDIKTKVDYVGYSEWTITGLEIDEFTIGGHNLEPEFRSHYGQYCHLIIEC